MFCDISGRNPILLVNLLREGWSIQVVISTKHTFHSKYPMRIKININFCFCIIHTSLNVRCVNSLFTSNEGNDIIATNYYKCVFITYM